MLCFHANIVAHTPMEKGLIIQRKHIWKHNWLKVYNSRLISELAGYIS